MTSDDDDPRSIGEALGRLVGRGVYSVELLEDGFPEFGFIYERSTDELRYRDRVVVVGSRDAQVVTADVEACDGLMFDGADPDIPIADAVAISDAVFRLLFPGRNPWGRVYTARDRAFAANCAAIRSGRGAFTWSH